MGKAALAGAPRPYALRRFVEKPDGARAAEFLASGRFFWNAGIFLFRASYLFEEMAEGDPLSSARHASRMAARHAGDLSRRSLLFFPFRFL